MPQRVLLVDDDREVTRVLRSLIDSVDRTVQVVEAPSAEEAMLEARLTPFDLAVVDIRLPGMDGLELMRRIRKTRPEAQVILITGNSTPRIEAEARQLNPLAYLLKPIRPNEFAAALQKGLGLKVMPAPVPEDAPAQPTIADRLSSLRRDLGCLAVYLADLDGQIIARAGDVSSFNIDELVRHSEVAFSASLNACRLLGGLVPQNLHFFDGDDYDVYVLNVGQLYMLIVLFSGEMGARQMGQVMRYGRQCADDMMNVIAESAPAAEVTTEAMPVVTETIVIPIPDAEPIIVPGTGPLLSELLPPPEPAEPVIEIKADVLDAASKSLTTADLDSFWDEAATQTEGGEETKGNALSFEQAVKLGLVPKEEEKEKS
jgi:CheY-like chemotaxis protein